MGGGAGRQRREQQRARVRMLVDAGERAHPLSLTPHRLPSTRHFDQGVPIPPLVVPLPQRAPGWKSAKRPDVTGPVVTIRPWAG
jgi:hypothetical protein